jgi:hypothetical protein
MRADQLQAHRESPAEAGGKTHSRQSGKVYRQGVDVLEVHRRRVVGFGAQGEGHAGSCRSGYQVDLLEGGGEVLGDETAQLLGFPVVGVVVPRGQDVGAHQDAPLYLRAKTLLAAARIKVFEVTGRIAAMTVAHAVVAGQVSGGFGGRDDVVGGNGQFRAWQGDVHERRTERLVIRQGLADYRFHAVIESTTEVLRGHADTQAAQILLQGLAVSGHRNARALVESRGS